MNMAGNGTFGVAGPLTLTNGGWAESDVDTTWSGSTPWQLGGGAGSAADTPPISAFEMVGGRLTISSATAAQLAPGGGDGMIELDGGATLFKQDATTTTLGVTVLLDSAEVHVVAGRLIGRFSGAGELSISPGATLGLSGTGAQFTPPAIDIKGGTIEVEPGADASLALPAMPALHHIGVLAGASLDVSVETGTGPVEAEAAPDDLAQEIAIGGGATLSIDGGGGILALAEGETLGGGGMLDGSLVNTAGTVAPNGKLNVTGNYSQAADGALALDLRSASDGDSLAVDGMADLAGTLRVATAYAPRTAGCTARAGRDVEAGGRVREDLRTDLGRARLGAGVRRHRRLAHARRAERRGRRACVADGARSAPPPRPSWAGARPASRGRGRTRARWPMNGCGAPGRSPAPRGRAIASLPPTGATGCRAA